MAERTRRLIALIIFAGIIIATPAQAKRVALVIGNSAYTHAPELANPRNDATDMAAALKALGFEVVDGMDLDKPAMDRKIRDFSVALSGADAAIFFYAGHGLQVSGSNFLVPTDAELSTSDALEFEMVRLDLVQRIMENNANTNILFLDACRNNPLSRNLARAMGMRAAGIGRGLAPAESGVGTLISFSTQPGNVALDGTERNSPFASALIKHLPTPGEDLSAILIGVRNDVMAATQKKQVPWEHSALTGRFYFKAPPEPAALPSFAPSLTGPGTTTLSPAAEAWDRTKDTANSAVMEAFVKRFGDTIYGDMARARLDELKSQQTAATVSPPATKPSAKKSAQPAVGVFEPERKPGETFRDCPHCPEMVVVPAGSFTMGSPDREVGRVPDEGPQRKVRIAKPFAVGKLEVTRDQFAAFVATAGHDPGDKCYTFEDNKSDARGARSFLNPGYEQDGSHPVACVNWDDAKAYAAWLTKISGKPYRLLTEAEWEYAARAGTSSRFSYGNEDQQCSYANGADQTRKAVSGLTKDWTFAACSDGYDRTAPSGSFKPNAFGLYDMHGNVYEWVEDCHKDSYQGAPTDGSASISGDCNRHPIRGGSWFDQPGSLRSAYHLRMFADARFSYNGFRVGRTLSARAGPITVAPGER